MSDCEVPCSSCICGIMPPDWCDAPDWEFKETCLPETKGKEITEDFCLNCYFYNNGTGRDVSPIDEYK